MQLCGELGCTTSMYLTGRQMTSKSSLLATLLPNQRQPLRLNLASLKSNFPFAMTMMPSGYGRVVKARQELKLSLASLARKMTFAMLMCPIGWRLTSPTQLTNIGEDKLKYRLHFVTPPSTCCYFVLNCPISATICNASKLIYMSLIFSSKSTTKKCKISPKESDLSYLFKQRNDRCSTRERPTFLQALLVSKR